MMHEYGFDLNYIISKGNEQNNQIEGFGLQLEDFLSNHKISPETDELVNMTINFLRDLVEDRQDSECECHLYR